MKSFSLQLLYRFDTVSGKSFKQYEGPSPIPESHELVSASTGLALIRLHVEYKVHDDYYSTNIIIAMNMFIDLYTVAWTRVAQMYK